MFGHIVQKNAVIQLQRNHFIGVFYWSLLDSIYILDNMYHRFILQFSSGNVVEHRHNYHASEMNVLYSH